MEKQLLLPFDELKEPPKPVYELPFFEVPADLNQELLNMQYRWLILNDRKAWQLLWELSIHYAESEIVNQQKKKGFSITAEEKQDKALEAVEYVLRRFTMRPGWCVKKNFISQIYGGVMHALYYRKKADEIVDFVDTDEAFKDFIYEENYDIQ